MVESTNNSFAATAAVEQPMDVDQQLNGGIHTNDETTVKQYFNYYAKLAN